MYIQYVYVCMYILYEQVLKSDLPCWSAFVVEKSVSKVYDTVLPVQEDYLIDAPLYVHLHLKDLTF